MEGFEVAGFSTSEASRLSLVWTGVCSEEEETSWEVAGSLSDHLRAPWWAKCGLR